MVGVAPATTLKPRFRRQKSYAFIQLRDAGIHASESSRSKKSRISVRVLFCEAPTKDLLLDRKTVRKAEHGCKKITSTSCSNDSEFSRAL